MDLIQYEQLKFELAAILRSVQVRLRAQQPKIDAPFADLFARLADDRFNLVVIGRFSRGKSSLMNALLETERLPVGIVPITSVITTVSYGTKERAFVEYHNSRLDRELALDELPEHITQQGNPGNQRGVSLARIELPSELLRRGFHFVDTPGLGSAIAANTRTTERFFPQADAFMLVTSFDSPLSEEELTTLRRIAPSLNRVFFVINKRDIVSAGERDDVLAHVQDQVQRVFGTRSPRMFSVSAREALEANRSRDSARYAASGVEELRAEVTRFLLTDRQTDFLLRMCERAADALKEVPHSEQEFDRLRAFQQSVVQSRPDANWTHGHGEGGVHDGTGFTTCEICEKLDHGLYDFLCHYQWEILSDQSAQARLAERGGLCAFHYWQLDSVASLRGICVGLSSVLGHWATRLEEVASTAEGGHHQTTRKGLKFTATTCDICRTHETIERAALDRMVGRLENTRGPPMRAAAGLCLPHLEMILGKIGPASVARRLLLGEAAALQRLSEDMRRYALKRDGLRRALASDEDLSAGRRALMLLGGHRNVFGPRAVQ